VSTTTSPRRYYLLKSFASRVIGEQLEHNWRALQESIPGTDLPEGFPSKSLLEAAGYKALEDIDGADSVELKEEVCLSAHQADAVIAAVEEMKD
jgi:hypothetical protein